MISAFRAGRETYYLKTDPLCCNRFGLAELFVDCCGRMSLPSPCDVLDVGCGAGPLGIYFAKQFSCSVVGVELNPIACACCTENLERFALTDRFRLVCDNFRQFAGGATRAMFDLIVSVPPIDTSVPMETVQRYAEQDFRVMDPRSFAYLTNSWHDTDGTDLLDLIFRYGQAHLRKNGRIVIVFCLIDCKDPAYVTRKAEQYHYVCVDQIEETIAPERVGASRNGPRELRVFVMNFRIDGGSTI